jgi:hypothetical protein
MILYVLYPNIQKLDIHQVKKKVYLQIVLTNLIQNNTTYFVSVFT